MLENRCEMIIAMTHGGNRHERRGVNPNEEFGELPEKGIPEIVWNTMSEFEKDWIINYQVRKNIFEKKT
jgi:hypothetical protein